VEEYIFSVESNGTEQNVLIKFCTLLLRFINIQFISIPTWSSTCSFLLKIANINIYVRHNFKLHVKSEAHYLGNWLTCCTTDNILHYIYYLMEFELMMSDSKWWNTIICSHIHTYIHYSEGKSDLNNKNEIDKHNNKSLIAVYLFIHSLLNLQCHRMWP